MTLAAVEIDLRPMTLEDVPEVHALEVACFPDPWSAKEYRGETNNPISVYYVARYGGVLLGMGGMWVVADEAHIGTMAVAHAHRRQGIARRIMDALLGEARRRGATVATLEVRVGNVAARNLYESYGFHVAGYRTRYYPDNGEDAAIMACALAGQDGQDTMG
jgi:[ribosomal protein S18]-alanine N-acetyltransferase